MRRSVCSALLLLALSAGGATPLPPRRLQQISDALCGRDNAERARAEAINGMDFGSLSLAWRALKLSELQPWFEAQHCKNANPVETITFATRAEMLRHLQHDVARARTIHDFEQLFNSIDRAPLKADDWPSDEACVGCAQLRNTLRTVLDAATKWPATGGKDPSLGTFLDDAQRLQTIVKSVCAARPPAEARQQLETKYRYYTWTDGGDRLLKIAAWFDRDEVVHGCSSQ